MLVGTLDVVSLLAAAGIVIAAMAVLFINEPPKDVAEKRTPAEPVPLYIELRWKDGEPHDVDTWVQCQLIRPDGGEDTYTVSYRQRHAGFLDLVWDDLGGRGTANFERVTSNSAITKIPPNVLCRGNVHLYSTHAGNLPLEGSLLVILDKDAPSEEALTPEVGLDFKISHQGEELTLFEIAWNQEGHLDSKTVLMYPKVSRTCLATDLCDKG
ncbi:MAG: hypothetical protein A2854_00960 [Parcubacteria group bacterium RIFCSPHIGHO2_01_FULL_56_18]|nr:MAG: hypothetical protein A2854_00960 [Parcubacteria group bacterium RIFCSPHIGHO2_01_FULL_56_18]